MQRLLASILLFCVGFSLPAAGGPLCLCIAGWAGQHADCCGHDAKDCSEECPKLEGLPDAPVPESAPDVPSVPVIDLAWLPELPPMSAPRLRDAVAQAERIRGPTSAPPDRAQLAIWRL